MSVPEAPRFECFLQQVEGKSVFTMSRAHWENLLRHEGDPVLIDVRQTPLGNVARQALVAMAEKEPIARIVIYRYDEKDAPTPYNVDRYSVFEDVEARWDLPYIVNAASTCDNENLRRYLQQNVFIVKEGPGDDHWLGSLPEPVLSMIRKT